MTKVAHNRQGRIDLLDGHVGTETGDELARLEAEVAELARTFSRLRRGAWQRNLVMAHAVAPEHIQSMERARLECTIRLAAARRERKQALKAIALEQAGGHR